MFLSQLVNEKNVQEADDSHGRWHIRDGIICVPRATIIPDGMVV